MSCPHGIYNEWGCQQCNPAPELGGAAPQLPRSSSDPLNADKTSKLESCQQCGNLRTFFAPACRFCGTAFPIDETTNRVQGTANAHAEGVCPDCGSTVHYEARGKKWQCADCDKIYPAPKRVKF